MDPWVVCVEPGIEPTSAFAADDAVEDNSSGDCKGSAMDKQCVECGATQTPQWREGPAGPKTLCNACGVRYNRLRSSKRNGGCSARHSAARNKGFKNSRAAKEARKAKVKAAVKDEAEQLGTALAESGDVFAEQVAMRCSSHLDSSLRSMRRAGSGASMAGGSPGGSGDDGSSHASSGSADDLFVPMPASSMNVLCPASSGAGLMAGSDAPRSLSRAESGAPTACQHEPADRVFCAREYDEPMPSTARAPVPLQPVHMPELRAAALRAVVSQSKSRVTGS